MTLSEVGAAYDARADEYVLMFGSADKIAPADLTLVSRWCDSTPGPLLDAGCGPGHWVPVLQRGDREVLGVDVSERFLAVARRSHPQVPFLRSSLDALPLKSGTLGGVLAWYSIIHTPPEALPPLLAELGRVLHPGGSLLLAFFDGDPGRRFDHAVVTAYSWSVDALQTPLTAAGFHITERYRRPDQNRRPHAALIARRLAERPTARPEVGVARAVDLPPGGSGDLSSGRSLL